MATIGQIAAGVAHEINNPMGFIGSNLNSLKKYMGILAEYINTSDGNSEELRKALKVDFILEDSLDLIDESRDGADRVKEIVQNLKVFSRVDQAEQKMSDINECLESTLKIIWNELKYKCTVTKEYGELPQSLCYPQQLNQVFMNLLVNAAQAIEEKGEITIRTREENGFIVISIADTGGGIPEENLGKLFEPFFTTKEVGKGTGLGLSIAYDIITKKHQGEIMVESEQGLGSTFFIRLPVVKEGQGDICE